ncbi:hypothetical protein FEM48_Zijuj07G0133200 [Ziziphus jujuba var. spinosa]|uniref:Uncharacterized protein n=1 Tax=Ziziphus jujuba var. spinosa TaxID=714518 RepID=A0A978V4V7_ZIZJJ|nr:hypothetical protein FEM48_Zijuj07G0133200 [Ziziphus jujuba var. spinosa]
MNLSLTSSISSSSSSASSSSTGSWLSGIVLGLSNGFASAKMPSKTVSVGRAGGDFSGPVVRKNQFRESLFKYGPKPIQVYFVLSVRLDSLQDSIFAFRYGSGIVENLKLVYLKLQQEQLWLAYLIYLEPLAIALDQAKWSLVQLLMSSSHTGFGTSSLRQVTYVSLLHLIGHHLCFLVSDFNGAALN